MHRVKNKTVDMKIDNGDVVVFDKKSEYFRMPKSDQTISIARSIYYAEKYEDVIREDS